MAGARRPRDPPKLTRARAAAGRRRQPAASPTQNPRVTLECEVLPGLEPFCGDELRRVLGRQVELAGGSGPGAVRFSWSGPLRALLGLRTAVAVYLLVSVPGRRPSTLLGDTTLFDQVETVRRLHRPGSFSSFRLSVPGRDSAALRRLRQELTARTGLGHDPDEGELYLRIRRSAGGDGWDLLTRLTPRPLSARGWRVARCSPSPTSSGCSSAACGRRRAAGSSSVRCRSTRRAITRSSICCAARPYRARLDDSLEQDPDRYVAEPLRRHGLDARAGQVLATVDAMCLPARALVKLFPGAAGLLHAVRRTGLGCVIVSNTRTWCRPSGSACAPSGWRSRSRSRPAARPTR